MTEEDVRRLPDEEYDEFLITWGAWLDENPDAFTFENDELVVLDNTMPEEARIMAKMLYRGSKNFTNILKTRAMMGLD